MVSDCPPPAQNVQQWPACGGATASIRFSPEIDHAANAGLGGALKLLEPIKARFPDVSYADLYQMASAVAVEVGSRDGWGRRPGCVWRRRS
jgi:L-ascorbate peroxidase